MSALAMLNHSVTVELEFNSCNACVLMILSLTPETVTHTILGFVCSDLLFYPFTAIVDYSLQGKQYSPSLDAAFKRRRLSWDFTFFCDIWLITIPQQIYFIYSIICFLKTTIILNVKVVPNDIFKFGGERDNASSAVLFALLSAQRVKSVVFRRNIITQLLMIGKSESRTLKELNELDSDQGSKLLLLTVPRRFSYLHIWYFNQQMYD